MRSQLEPAHYLSTEIFDREQSLLFAQSWIFAGLASMVNIPDAFFTRTIAGRQIVVQNFDGELRAFENVCAHRQKLIQTERFGCRPLVCGYHGWRYSKDGRVTMVPFEADCYRFDATERTSLGLRQYELRQVGSLVFVNLSDAPSPLAQQFSPELLADLESVSECFDADVLFASWTGEFNWKLAYENLRDSLHPRFVHTRSLNLEVRFGKGTDGADRSASDRDTPVDLRKLSFGGTDGDLLQDVKHGFHEQVERWGSTDAYFNWLLYPTTHIVSPDGGYLFSIEHHIPLSPSRTEINAFYMTARKKRQYAGAPSVLWEYAKGAKRILDEDTSVMEEVQRGLSPALGRGHQGIFEHQNRLTDRWYLNRIGGFGG